MKKIVLLFSCFFVNFIYSYTYYGNVDYKISNIKNQQYTLYINFVLNQDYNDVYFGFYLLNSLIRNQNFIHIDLFRENKLDRNLSVLKLESGITTKGYLAFLSSEKKISLESNIKYSIRITNLINPPKNISAFPQRFFVFNNINHKAYTLQSKFLQSNYVVSEIYQNKLYKFTPKPQEIKFQDNYVKWSNNVYFHNCYKKQFNFCNKIKNKPEGYVINIANKIDVYANNAAGFLYANVTLKKLHYYNKKIIQKQLIIDYPYYKYRGLMLDTVRHFISKETLIKIIDMMADLKLNTLHLHLADDEGWRLELDNLPNLISFSAYRNIFSKIPLIITDDLTNGTFIDDVNQDYGGFYTTLQMKSIIKYANNKNITIIPEIDMPSHALAMKYAYESFLLDRTDFSKYTSIQGYDNNVLPICMYNYESKFSNMINKIIQEVAEVFSRQNTIYANFKEISIGGDEVPNNAWESSLYCKKKPWASVNNSFKTHIFFKMLANSNSNIKFSGWQQVVLDDNSLFDESYVIKNSQIGHLWNWLPSNHKNTESNLSILNKHKYPIILSFADKFYFDIKQGNKFWDRGLYWSTNYLDVNQLMLVIPKLDKFNKLNNIVGVEASLWTELIPNENILFFMLYPRIITYAEISWIK
jgi:N-acetyl-beta-hexosaminidase